MCMRPVLPDDPAGLRAWRDATLYRLVSRMAEAERWETLTRLRQRGYQDVTNTDTALLANLDTADTTIDALEIVAEIEAEYAGFLGAGRLAVLKELLTDLVGHADPGGTLGGD